jgi:DNA-binding CsgD family transcriptional regulator
LWGLSCSSAREIATGSTLNFHPEIRCRDDAAAGAWLVEREPEVARITQCVEAVAAGASGLLVIEGQAGIGKTALLDAARQQAASAGVRSLTARAGELERDEPYGIVRQWLEPELKSATGARRERLLEGAAGLAEPALVSGPAPAEAADSPATLHGFYWLLANLAADDPVLLLIDDAHWADAPSLRLLDHLSRRLEGMRLGLVLACRPPGLDDEGELLARLIAEPSAPIVRPALLTIDGVQALLRDALGDPPDAAFAQAAHAATGGNPFYVRELGRALCEQGVRGTAAEVARIDAVAPRSLARSILMRVSPPARELARALAVLDEPAEPALAAELASLDRDAASVAAAELARAGLIGTGRPMALAHAIVRAAVLASLSGAERSTWHRRAATLLAGRRSGAERGAIHLLAAEPSADPDVATTLLEAARLALARGAPEVGARMLRRALAEPPGADAVDDVLLALGRAEAQADQPTAAEHLWELYRSSQDPVRRGEALRGLPQAMGPHPDRLREAAAALDRTIPEVGPLDSELALRLEALRLGISYMLPGEGPARDRQVERFLGLPGTTPAECALLAMCARAMTDAGKSAGEVVAVAERAIANPRALEAEGPGSLFLEVCAALRQGERFDLLDPFLDRALALARQRGSTLGFVVASVWRSLSARLQGMLREAEAEGRAALDAVAPHGIYRLGAITMVVEALIEQGRMDEGRLMLDSAAISEELDAQRPSTQILLARAALRHASGDRELALADLRHAFERIGRYTSASPIAMDARLRLVEILHELGRDDDALAEAERALTIARNWGTGGKLGAALRAHANLIGGEEGIAQLRRASDLLASSPLRLERAKALIDLGAALRRAGRRADAREPLRAGLDLAERAAAAPLADRAREELAASGIRVPRQRVGDQLTPSEQRIVEMAASGATNPQIAQALFVTTKTVESHLANAYRKLGISSRRELTQPGAQQRTSPV